MRKKIPNFEKYEVDEQGKVYNIQTNRELKGSISANGYRYFRYTNGQEKGREYAHRLVAKLFLENPNNLPCVNHKDGNKLNNNLTNLEWVNYSDNVFHAYSIGLLAHTRAKREKAEDFEGEIWKEIPKYSHYSISNFGRVKNNKTNLLLKPSESNTYYQVCLSKDGKTANFLIHYLVFENFSNQKVPKNKILDHIDGNKKNNNFENLRIVSPKENALYALYKQNLNKTAKAVVCFDKDKNFIKVYKSCRSTEVDGFNGSSVSKACRRWEGTIYHGGYRWEFLTPKILNDYPEIADEYNKLQQEQGRSQCGE